MRKAGFSKLVKDTAKHQAKITQEVLEIWKDYDPKDFTKAIYQKLDRIKKQNTYRFELVEDIDIKRFQDTVKEAILKEKSRKWLSDELKKRTALTRAHCDTLSKTSISGYTTAANMEKAIMGGIKKFMYMGLRTEHTRFCCNKWLDKGVFTKEEISKLDNGMLKPVWIHRGGYNCVHRWVAWE